MRRARAGIGRSGAGGPIVPRGRVDPRSCVAGRATIRRTPDARRSRRCPRGVACRAPARRTRRMHEWKGHRPARGDERTRRWGSSVLCRLRSEADVLDHVETRADRQAPGLPAREHEAVVPGIQAAMREVERCAHKRAARRSPTIRCSQSWHAALATTRRSARSSAQVRRHVAQP